VGEALLEADLRTLVEIRRANYMVKVVLRPNG